MNSTSVSTRTNFRSSSRIHFVRYAASGRSPFSISKFFSKSFLASIMKERKTWQTVSCFLYVSWISMNSLSFSLRIFDMPVR